MIPIVFVHLVIFEFVPCFPCELGHEGLSASPVAFGKRVHVVDLHVYRRDGRCEIRLVHSLEVVPGLEIVVDGVGNVFDLSGLGKMACPFGLFRIPLAEIHRALFACPLVQVLKDVLMHLLQVIEVKLALDGVHAQLGDPKIGHSVFNLSQIVPIADAQLVVVGAGRGVDVRVHALLLLAWSMAVFTAWSKVTLP